MVFDVRFVSPEVVGLVFTTLFVVALVQVFLEMRVDVTAQTRFMFKSRRTLWTLERFII